MEISHFGNNDEKQILKNLGFIFSGRIVDDTIFAHQYVKRPIGWKKYPDSFNTFLEQKFLDKENRVRVVIELIDGSLRKGGLIQAKLLTRYRIKFTPEKGKPNAVHAFDAINPKKIFFSVKIEYRGQNDEEAEDEAINKLVELLNKNFPGWTNPAAYW